MTRGAATWTAAGGLAAVCALLFVFAGSRPARVKEPEPLPSPFATSSTDERAPFAATPTPGAPPSSLPPVTLPSASSRPWRDENALMEYLRSIQDGDPATALDAARQGDQLFPGGDGAAERAMIEVKSLAREGHLSEARGAAERMVNTYPGTRWALEVERHTGAHPRLNH